MGTGGKICKLTTGIGEVVSHPTIHTTNVLEVLCWISSSVATIFLKTSCCLLKKESKSHQVLEVFSSQKCWVSLCCWRHPEHLVSSVG